jgi:hypothetical protein
LGYREALEVLRYGTGVYVYQTLTVWPDMLATYAIREIVQKRLYRLVHRVAEFPLTVPFPKVVETFGWAGDQLRLLDEPPGKSARDRALLAEIESRWLATSYEEAY